MRKHVLLVSFAALCATVSTAGAMPVAPAPAAIEIVEPVTYYGYGYHHHYGYHHRYGYYHHHYGYHHRYGYRHRRW
jgi:hypothetical protein